MECEKIAHSTKLSAPLADNLPMRIQKNIAIPALQKKRLGKKPLWLRPRAVASAPPPTLVERFQTQTQVFFSQFNEGKVYEAAATIKETLRMVDAELQGHPSFFLPAHSQWIDVLLTLGDVGEARKSVAQAHARFAGRLPEGSPFLAMLYCEESKIHFFSGEFLEAARKSKIAAEIFVACQDGFRGLAPRALSRLSESQLALGQLPQAEANIRLAMAIHEDLQNGQSPQNSCLFILVRILSKQGRHQEAHDYLVAHSRKFPQGQRDRPLYYFEWLTHYGVALMGLGQMDDAKAAFESALNLREEVQGKNTTSALFVLSKLVAIAIHQEKWGEAEDYQFRIAQIALKVHGGESFQMATALKNLAQLQIKNGKDAIATQTVDHAMRVEAAFVAASVRKFREQTIFEVALFDVNEFAPENRCFRFCNLFFIDAAEIKKFCPDNTAKKAEQMAAIEKYFAEKMMAQNVMAAQRLSFATLGVYDSADGPEALPSAVAVFMFLLTPNGQKAGPESLHGHFIQKAIALYEREVRSTRAFQWAMESFQSDLATQADPFFARHGRLYVQKDVCPGALTGFVWIPFQTLSLETRMFPSAEAVNQALIQALAPRLAGLQEEISLRQDGFSYTFLPLSVTQESAQGFCAQGVMLSLTVAPEKTAKDRDAILARAQSLYYRLVVGDEG